MLHPHYIFTQLLINLTLFNTPENSLKVGLREFLAVAQLRVPGNVAPYATQSLRFSPLIKQSSTDFTSR